MTLWAIVAVTIGPFLMSRSDFVKIHIVLLQAQLLLSTTDVCDDCSKVRQVWPLAGAMRDTEQCCAVLLTCSTRFHPSSVACTHRRGNAQRSCFT